MFCVAIVTLSFFVFTNLALAGEPLPATEITLSGVAPTPLDLKLFLEESNQKLKSIQKPVSSPSCLGIENPKPQPSLDQEYVCVVRSESSLKDKIFDPKDEVRITFDTANDANILKLREEGNPNARLSNDTGYTLGANIKYERENVSRLWRLELDSKLFTARVKGPNGSFKSPEGRYYIDTHEVSQLNLYAEDKSKFQDVRVIGQAGVRLDSTDGNGASAQVLNYWHETSDRYKSLKYHILPGGSSKLSLELQAGVKKVLEADLSQVHCMASGAVMTGVDSSGNLLLTTQLKGEVSTGSMGGRSQSSPYFLLKLLQDSQQTGRERTVETRIEAGSYIFAQKKMRVYVGVGRGKFVTQMAPQIPKDDEIINYIVLRSEFSY